jgi:iron-sulfur cluster repair protein YtfE (RIC family)
MVDTATTTLAVNAAFLQEIKEDHVELRELLVKVQRALAQSRRRRKPRELVYLFLALQDRLAMHFSLEEAYGYCEDAIEMAPRLSSQALALRAEHSTLFSSFCHLVEDTEELLTPIPKEGRSLWAKRVSLVDIAARYELFHEALEEHERRENELILAAFDDDLGVGD